MLKKMPASFQQKINKIHSAIGRGDKISPEDAREIIDALLRLDRSIQSLLSAGLRIFSALSNPNKDEAIEAAKKAYIRGVSEYENMY